VVGERATGAMGLAEAQVRPRLAGPSAAAVAASLTEASVSVVAAGPAEARNAVPPEALAAKT
jgi:hypothetical protein